MYTSPCVCLSVAARLSLCLSMFLCWFVSLFICLCLCLHVCPSAWSSVFKSHTWPPSSVPPSARHKHTPSQVFSLTVIRHSSSDDPTFSSLRLFLWPIMFLLFSLIYRSGNHFVLWPTRLSHSLHLGTTTGMSISQQSQLQNAHNTVKCFASSLS